jgi:predicted ATPase
LNKKVNLDQGTDLPEKFILTDEFKKLHDKIENTTSNLFITGKAGCGKSTLLEYFRQNTNLCYTYKEKIILCDKNIIKSVYCATSTK